MEQNSTPHPGETDTEIPVVSATPAPAAEPAAQQPADTSATPEGINVISKAMVENANQNHTPDSPKSALVGEWTEPNTEEDNALEPAPSAPEAPKEPESPKHDAKFYAKQAYECFIKNADKDTSDADPIAAIQRVFNQRASEELKAQVAAEGKTAEGAFQFLWAIARFCKQTEGGVHIPPETGYAIAMHYFQDVPADVLDEYEPALIKAKEEREAAERKARAEKAEAERKAKAKSAPKGKAKSKGKGKTATTTESTPKTEVVKGTCDPKNLAEAVKESYESAVGHKLDYDATPSQNPSKTPVDASEPKMNNEPSKGKPTPPTPAHEQISLFDGLFS